MSKRMPKYCRHKASGQAVVRIDSRDHYLGKYGSSESRAEYNRLLTGWGAEQELVPGSVHDSLKKVAGLRKGKTTAPEMPKIKPADDVHVEATLPHLPRPVRAMVQVQRCTGMRPAEVTIMRPCDIDRSG